MAIDLKSAFQKIDVLLKEKEMESIIEGAAIYPKPIRIKVIGQFALLLAFPNHQLAATNDLDAIITNSGIEKRLFLGFMEELLPDLVVDEDAFLATMHPKTEYATYFEGDLLTVLIAKPEYVVESKCRFKRKKDKNQIKELLKKEPELKKQVIELKTDLGWIDEN